VRRTLRQRIVMAAAGRIRRLRTLPAAAAGDMKVVAVVVTKKAAVTGNLLTGSKNVG